MHIPTAAPCLVIAMQFVKLGFLLQLNGEKSLDKKKKFERKHEPKSTNHGNQVAHNSQRISKDRKTEKTMYRSLLQGAHTENRMVSSK